MVAVDVVFGMTGGIICTLKATLQKMIINSAVQIVCVDRTAGSALLTSGMTSRAKLGITSRLQIGDSNIPPTITQASGCCTWAPMPVDTAAGTRPMQAENPVMKICRIRVSDAPMIASSLPNPWSRACRIYETSRMPSIAERLRTGR